MVRKSGTSQDALGAKLPRDVDPNGDVDVDSDMVVGDFEIEMERAASTRTTVNPDQGSIKSDAMELVDGKSSLQFLFTSNQTSRSISQVSPFSSTTTRTKV